MKKSYKTQQFETFSVNKDNIKCAFKWYASL